MTTEKHCFLKLFANAEKSSDPVFLMTGNDAKVPPYFSMHK